MRYQLTHPAPMKPAANKPRTPVSTAMQIVESQLIECAACDARNPDSSSLLVSRREETRNTPLVVARSSLRSGGLVANDELGPEGVASRVLRDCITGFKLQGVR